MSRIETIRDPITGDQITFVGEDASKIAWSIEALAARHQMMVKEVYRMMRVAMFGAKALDDNFDPCEELEKLQAQAEEANALLTLNLPLDELLAIFRRGREALRFAADLRRSSRPWRKGSG
jgi:hypothetical protein